MLQVNAGHNINNVGGVINITNGSVLNQLGSTISRGTITTTGTGAVVAYSSTANILSNVTLNGQLDATTIANARERIANGITLNGNVNIANGGIVSLDSTSVAANSIGGTGTFNLNDAGARIALDGNGTTTLGANIVARGQGNIGGPMFSGGTNNLINNGRISADVGGGTLDIIPGGGSGSVTNNGLFDARGSGTLQLSANINNAAGLINAQNGSVVLQNATTITGGTIGSTGTGVFRANGSASNFLDAVNLAGTLDLTTVANSRERIINGATINGAINVANGGILGLDSSLTTGGNQTISGTGVINLNDAAAHLSINGNGATTLDSGITVRGQGSIGSAAFVGGTNTLTSNGLISSDVAGGTLNITAPGNSGSFINNGTLQSINGGKLLLSTNVTANAGSQIIAGAGSSVVQNGVTINGVINASGTGVFTATGSPVNFLDGVNFTGTLDLSSIANSRERIINGATINGAINVANGGILGLDSSLSAGGNQTIGGTGVINLNDAAAHLSINGNGATTLTSGITVRGQGSIGSAAFVGGTNTLTNKGLISADINGGTLRIDRPAGSGAFINDGTLQAINGSRLLLSTNVTANAGSQIIAGAGSAVVQNGVTINGVINASGSGVFTAVSSTANFLDGVNFTGTLDLSSIANSRERIGNGATINGAINVANGGILGLDSSLTTGGNQTIGGTGVINLNDAAAHLSINGNGASTLDSGITVRGQGSIGSAAFVGGTNTLTNKGLISADINGGTLSIDRPAGSGAFINDGTLQAINSSLLLLSTNVTANAGSQIIAGVGSAVLQNGAAINGVVNTSGTGVFRASSNGANILTGVTLNGTLDATTIANSRDRISNDFTLNGVVNIANGGIVSLDSTLGAANSIGGTGTFNLNDAGARLAIEGNGTTALGANIVVRGQGNVGTALIAGGTNNVTNNGRISADVAGGTLSITNPASGGGSFTNNNLLDARSGGTLLLSTNIDNSAGLVNAQNASVVLQSGMTLSGGTVATSGTGVFRTTTAGNNFLSNVAVSGVIDMTTVANSRERIINGATINGAINVANGGILNLDSTATTGFNQTIGGTGVINLNDASARLALEGTGVTTLAAGLTVRGQGNIGTPLYAGGTNTLTNNGTILADGGTLTIAAPANGGTLTGTGTLQTSGGTLNLATGSASTQGKLVMGGAGSALNLNTQNLTITNDYTNAQSGSGNSFIARAGVTGTGQILAGGGAAQVIAGSNITNGNTNNATLTIGNVHVGANTFNYQINDSSATGPILRGAIQTSVNGGNLTDTRLSGSGVTASNYSSSNGPLAVTYTTTSAGVQTLSGQVLNLASNFDNIGDQKLNIVMGNGAAAYNLAQGSATPTPVTIANQRIGGTTGQILTVTNTAPSSFTEGLNASFGANTGDASNNGLTLTRLPGNSSNGSTMSVGVNTGSAGAKIGTVTLNYVSDGLNTSGLGLTSVGSQSINVSGNVYQAAIGNAPSPVQVANQRVLGTNTATVTVANSASGPSGFVEDLNVSVGASSGAATGSGTITGRLAGTNNTGTGAVLASVDTGSAGAKTGTVTLNYQTAGTVNGVSNSLNAAGAGSQAVTVSGNVYQVAAGTLNSAPLNFGTVQVGQNVSQVLSITNSASGAAGFVEDLNASFGATTGTGSSLISGTGTINGLLAGATNTSAMTVNVSTAAAGTVAGNIAVNYFSAGAVNGVSNGLGILGIGSSSYGVNGTIQAVANVINQASPIINNSPINLGNVRVGAASPSAFVSVTNQATVAPQAALNASISGSGLITGGGSFNLLNPGATNANSLQVGMDTATAGARNGTATIALVSDASNVGGCAPNCQLNLASQNVQVTGGVYNVAQANVASTVNLGNVRIGNSASQALTISNTNIAPAGFQEGLNASVGAVAGATASGGPVTNLAAGNSSNAISVGMNVAGAGAQTGTVTLNLASNGTGTSGLTNLALADATVNVNATGYRLANAQNVTPSLSLAARVGDVASGNVSITNQSPDVYTEALKVQAGAAPSGFVLGANPANIAAQGTGFVQVSLNTATAGTSAGSLTLNNISTGAGTTNAADIGVGSSNVSLAGKVYTAAVGQVNTAIVDFGIVRVGDIVAAKNIAVQNNAAVTALNDTLRANLSGVGGPFTGSGTVSGIGAQSGGNIAVGLNTSAAGVHNQTGTVSLLSQNPDLADIVAGVSSNVIAKAQINNLANATYSLFVGLGALTQAGDTFTLDLGNIALNTSNALTLKLGNSIAGPADDLSGLFDLSQVDDFTASGWGSINGLSAGQKSGPLGLSFLATTVGLFQDTIDFNGFSTNASDLSGVAQHRQLIILANVVNSNGTVPEPGTLMLLAIALASMLIQRRRAMLH